MRTKSRVVWALALVFIMTLVAASCTKSEEVVAPPEPEEAEESALPEVEVKNLKAVADGNKVTITWDELDVPFGADDEVVINTGVIISKTIVKTPYPDVLTSEMYAVSWSETEIALEWDLDELATGYLIERAERADGDWASIYEADTDEYKYIDGGLPAGAERWYRVAPLYKEKRYEVSAAVSAVAKHSYINTSSANTTTNSVNAATPPADSKPQTPDTAPAPAAPARVWMEAYFTECGLQFATEAEAVAHINTYSHRREGGEYDADGNFIGGYVGDEHWGGINGEYPAGTPYSQLYAELAASYGWHWPR